MLFLFYLYDWLTCGFYYLNKGSQGFDSKRPQFLGPARVSLDRRIKSPKALDSHGLYTLPVCVPIRNTGWNTKACAYSCQHTACPPPSNKHWPCTVRVCWNLRACHSSMGRVMLILNTLLKHGSCLEGVLSQ